MTSNHCINKVIFYSVHLVVVFLVAVVDCFILVALRYCLDYEII